MTSSSKYKGKDVDWEATAKMLSWPSDADEPHEQETGTGKKMDLEVKTERLTTTPDVEAPQQDTQTAKLMETIKLVYDLDEMEIERANHIRFSTSRHAPPPLLPPLGTTTRSKSAWPDVNASAWWKGEETEEEIMTTEQPEAGTATLVQPRGPKRKKSFPPAPRRPPLGSSPIGSNSNNNHNNDDDSTPERWECHKVCFPLPLFLRDRWPHYIRRLWASE